eukprot:CAMPEP_0182448066 /NCGR_PEP_ID=MMETSP1172-20130603/23232_1 /TAXON_ID=708627 /ORGANISM="Timspurckia oligopyrenoides, Strain CCMP3278" /LENGTH=710 /DNA_ID=CAMNT_0024644787 /DNA_START=121 /DNA_END=2250 /DNA_ORIENTATION=+
MAFSARMFSVIRYESIIHEFDPWFNYRSAQVLVKDGTYAFWNWFDYRSWYPLGRVVGGTVYPGIMYTAGLMYHAVHALGFPHVHIREVCVLTAPIFSGLTAIAAYLSAAEAHSSGAGLFAALLVSIVPGYMSRSVAGSFDNEGVAITALITSFFTFMRAVNTGSIAWMSIASLAYMYMVSTWGGYIFIINIIPIYVLVMLLLGRYSHRLYVAYSGFYVLGTLLSMQIRFVGFNAIQSKENLGALGVFGILNLYVFSKWLNSFLSPRLFRQILSLFLILVLSIAAIFMGWGLSTGFFGPWEGRFYTILDPTYASKYIPIIASVSEHQPTAWNTYVMDLHFLLFFFPVGLYYVVCNITDVNLLLLVYASFAAYFSGVMTRLMLVLAPAATLISSIGLSTILSKAVASLRSPAALKHDTKSTTSLESATSSTGGRSSGGGRDKTRGKATAPSGSSNLSRPSSVSERKFRFSGEISVLIIGFICVSLWSYIRHCLWMANHHYSSPSVVMQVSDNTYWDDFREAYYWLSQNTEENAKVLSWWDYGYQIAGMANRTTIVDNNTWNNSHIATVGRALNSPEKKANLICRKLDADYVLILFGGYSGYSSDDIAKFLWPVRISASVDPSVKESEYLSKDGQYLIDEDNAGPAFKKSIMYRLSYYRFDEVKRGYGPPMDRARNAPAPSKPIRLRYFEEAFTTSHWIVRIYRVKKPSVRGW